MLGAPFGSLPAPPVHPAWARAGPGAPSRRPGGALRPYPACRRQPQPPRNRWHTGHLPLPAGSPAHPRSPPRALLAWVLLIRVGVVLATRVPTFGPGFRLTALYP